MDPILQSQLRALYSKETFSNNGPRVTLSSGKIIFAKIGSLSDVEQFTGEAESLRVMAIGSESLVPKVLATGVDPNSQRPYMISEYFDLSPLTTSGAIILARKLAIELHSHKSEKGFGFDVPTYCGVTRLSNGWHNSWGDAFASMIQTLLDGLESKGHRFDELVKLGRTVQTRVIPHLLGTRLKVDPVILHGDLWSGNVGVDASGNPIIFDPASYYGHNEADFSIARMFGGFPPVFYEEYHKHIPKSDPVEEYDQRATLYELFHHLNHTLMFGGGYAHGAKDRMEGLLSYIGGAV